jgi:hypothetical protein
MHGCARCRRQHDSLARTVESLGSLRAEPATGIADSVIAAIGAEGAPTRASQADPPLTVVTASGVVPRADTWRDRARAAFAYCFQRRQLQATLTVALCVGVLLTIVNQGGMLFHGELDLGMCAMCASNFVVPFVALNIALLMIVRPGARRRP